MSQYTEFLSRQAEQLSPLDDAYEQKLLAVASGFRDFGIALTEFLTEHGYGGDPADVQEKAKYLKERYRTEQVEDLPRDFRKWFAPGMKLKRETVFPLLFALHLNLEQSDDFFRRVQLERSFDCHTAAEAVYYFCIKNDLPYSRAKQALEQIKLLKQKEKSSQEVLYTGSIVSYLDNAEDLSRVVSYICENRLDFTYNNTTAAEFIREIWSEITREDGLAAAEGRLIEDTLGESAELFREDLPVTADAGASTWIVYAQILGLDHYTEKKYAATRSLAPVFTRSLLLPLRASECFPNRQSIEGVLRGKKGDHEVFRKMLILLVFYMFWVKRAIRQKSYYAEAEEADAERCLDRINAYLLDAGYPELYAGNPYDWIFLWSLHDELPLAAFRTYMGEIFAVDSENAGDD